MKVEGSGLASPSEVRNPPSTESSSAWTLFRKRWRNPRQLTVTRVGKIFIVITTGIGLGALNTGNNLLYLVLGFLLSVIVLSGVLSERILRDLSVRRALPNGVRAGEPFQLRYEITKKKGAAFALKVNEHRSRLVGWGWAPHFDETEPCLITATMVIHDRGPLLLREIQVSTFFPFGLFEKSRLIEVSDLLLVWPRRGFACEVPADATTQHMGESGVQRLRDGAGDLAGLRLLREGEDARRIHWKKSASSQTLVRVERERDDRKQYRLTLDDHAAETLERACEEMAALSEQLISQGHEVGLRSKAVTIRPSSGPVALRKILNALAWAGFSKGAP
jgi:uncharacterized protein (DUF58 family)